MLLVSYVEAALAVDSVGAGSLSARSLVVLGTGLLAIWSSVVFLVHVKAVSAIVDVGGVKSLAVVFTGCVDAIGGASCSAIPLALHVEAASVVDLAGAGPLGTRSLGGLDAGLLATWSSVVFPVLHVEAASAIVAVLALYDPSVCSVARFGLSMDFRNAFAVLAVMSRLEALGVGSAIFPDLI